jgi:adenine/guanine phosphoribosyltransferase-like PRPP-binding protein
MKVHFVCGYYSDLAHNKKRRPEDYWDAYFYVWAVKIGSFRKKFFIHGADRKIGVTQNNFSVVRKMFGRFIAQQVQKDWGLEVDLVPVPSKDGIIGAADFRTSRMLEESLVSTTFKGKSLKALYWSKELDKAHQGGSRRRDFLKEHLTTDIELKGRKIVLMDDLLSTGGSLLASKDFLENQGATVLGAVTCGKTIYDFKTKPFGRQSLELTEELSDFEK